MVVHNYFLRSLPLKSCWFCETKPLLSKLLFLSTKLILYTRNYLSCYCVFLLCFDFTSISYFMWSHCWLELNAILVVIKLFLKMLNFLEIICLKCWNLKKLQGREKNTKIDGKLPIFRANVYLLSRFYKLSFLLVWSGFQNKIVILHTSAEPENMLWYMSIHCGFVPLSACQNKGWILKGELIHL